MKIASYQVIDAQRAGGRSAGQHAGGSRPQAPDRRSCGCAPTAASRASASRFYGGRDDAHACTRAVEDLRRADGRRGSDAHRGDRRQAARRGRQLRARAASSRWPCRRSTSRCGTSRARRSTSRCGNCSAAIATRVPTYASGSLRRGLTDKQAEQAARILVQKGFREMKTQMALPGDPTPADEVRRVRVVREAIGPDIKLMCDINQRWRPEQAIDIGSRVEDAGVGLFWLEDVTTADDYPGPRARHRGAHDAGRRRRVCLGHRAVPPHDRGALGRHRDDRSRAGRRHHASG